MLKTENGFFQLTKAIQPTTTTNNKIDTPNLLNTNDPDFLVVRNCVAQINPELTRREKEVLFYLSEGLSNQEIADRIYVDKRTVENHLQHIKEKLNFESMQELRKFALSLKQTTNSLQNV